MQIGDIIASIIKIAALLAYIYGLLWVLGQPSKWVKLIGIVAAFGIIQLALSLNIGGFQIFTGLDRGLLFQASAMAMVVIGLNLIYGFNGQFSLGQWGFYGIGAYVSADITYRWAAGDARGLLVVGIVVALGGLMIWGVRRWLIRMRDVPVLSAFTLYLVGFVLTGAIALGIANVLEPVLKPLLKTADGGAGILATGIPMQVLFFISVILAGAFAAEISFLFGLPVLTLGSDYFGIATLGFTIVVKTLMVNSDTILPFPEMRGGRGMLGIPQMEGFSWFWTFIFLLAIIVIMRNIIRSSTGRSILSVREDETAAKVMGINVAETKLLAFVIGSLFAGIGGAIYAHTTGTSFLSPATFDFLPGFNPLIIVVFGGLGSVTGSIAASFGWIFFLEGLLRSLLGMMGTEAPTWRFVLYPITLLLLMLLRPQGLLGTVEWGFLKAKSYAARRIARPEAASAAGPAETGG
jgi:branched-chain amino acid transport system permease protein